MLRSRRPLATVAMNGCVIPAPAPWAKTKQARARGGCIRMAETESALPVSMVNCCILAARLCVAAMSITLAADTAPGIKSHDIRIPVRLAAASTCRPGRCAALASDATAGGAGVGARQRARMVRLRRLRLFRQHHVGVTVFGGF